MRKKTAFCLFKYFPYGGLQRDFIQIATTCKNRGYDIRIYVLSWEGKIPLGFDVRFVPVKALQNHTRVQKYFRWVANDLDRDPVDCVIGFNRMPRLDVYFASDNCFCEKAERQRGWLYRFSGRYRVYSSFEKAVFSAKSDTVVLLIAESQRKSYYSYYGTSEDRLKVLPPGVSKELKKPENATDIRKAVRCEWGVSDSEFVLLQVGSGFITKGVDRSIYALAALPDELRKRTRYFVVGKDCPGRFLRLAHKLGVCDRICFFGGRDDIACLLQGADLMVHPSINEAGGIVLLEGIIAGLPVVCTAACGYAVHIERSGCGCVIPEPYQQENLNRCLREMLTSDKLFEMGQCGLQYAEETDLYSQHEVAADIIEQVIEYKS
ncbi:MAG: glycosyltransferase family 4 protein [Desulfobacterales bacterium]|nr:glycosyltransferase family 4 protein [Desulfobacterales bacterium]